MKKLLIFFVCILAVQGLHSQKSVDKFMDKMKKHKDAYVVTLPGWLLRTGAEIIDDEELRYEHGFHELVEGIKRLRVLHIGNDPNLESSKFRSIMSQIKEKDGYVDYATVKDQGTNVQVIVKEDKTRIKSLVLVASGNDGLTILNLKTDIDMEDLKAANLTFNKN